MINGFVCCKSIFCTKRPFFRIHWHEVMKMRRKRWGRRRPVGWGKLWLIAVSLAVLLLLAGSYRRLEGLVAVYGENRCRNLVTQLLLDAASETRADEKLSSFTNMDDKSILQLDSAAVRQYQAAVGKSLTQKLDALGEQTYPVPLGTVLENAFLMERGPELPIRFVPVGSAQVDISSGLWDAGVNQVLYRVVMTLSAEITVLLPGGSTTVVCQQEFVLEETLLTGQVPLLYGG